MSYRLLQTVVDMTGIPATEKIVLVVLARYADDNGTNVFPSVETVAEKAGLNGRSVRRAVLGLEARGLVKRLSKAGGRGISNRYVIVINTPENADPESVFLEKADSLSIKADSESADSINKEIKEERGDARAIPEILTPVQRAIEAFDDARASAFGRRSKPHRRDAEFARQFLDKISLPDLIAIISSEMPTADPANPPATLAWFRSSVERFAADRISPGKDRSNVKRHPTAHGAVSHDDCRKLAMQIARASVGG